MCCMICYSVSYNSWEYHESVGIRVVAANRHSRTVHGTPRMNLCSEWFMNEWGFPVYYSVFIATPLLTYMVVYVNEVGSTMTFDLCQTKRREW